MSIHIYRLTKNGKKVANKVTMSNRNRYLDFLNKCSNKTATDEDMALHFGVNKTVIRMDLRRMPRLVEDLTRDGGI
jgi:hypothetical protein